MKLEISREVLLGALDRVVLATETKSTIAILGCVRLDTDGRSLNITGNNLKAQAHMGVACAGVSGAACVASDRLQSFVSGALKGATVTMELRDGKLRVAAGRSRVDLPVLPHRDMPVMEFRGNGKPFAMSCDVLQKMLAFVMPHRGEDPRYAGLDGVRLRGIEGVIEMAATDAKRAALMTGSAVAETFSIVIPPGVFALLAKLGDNATDQVTAEIAEVAGTPNLLRLVSGDFEMVTKLIDTDYPRVENIIPEITKTPIVFDIEPMAAAMSRVLSLTDEVGKSRSAVLTMAGETLAIDAGTADATQFHDELDAEGPAYTAQFNARFLRDAMTSLGGEGQAELHLGGHALAPIRLNRTGNPTDCVTICPMTK